MNTLFKYVLIISLAFLLILLAILGYLYLSNRDGVTKLPTFSMSTIAQLPIISKLSPIDPRFEFNSEVPDYDIQVGNTEQFNKLSTDLEIFSTNMKFSKIKVTFSKFPLDEYGNRGLGYTITSDDDKNRLISNSASLFYPDQNTVEFKIYIDLLWMQDPNITPTNISPVENNKDDEINQILSFQFLYLLSNLNYNKMLTLTRNKEAINPRLDFAQLYLDTWNQKPDSYPLEVVNRKK